jgi:hypothetical protein
MERIHHHRDLKRWLAAAAAATLKPSQVIHLGNKTKKMHRLETNPRGSGDNDLRKWERGRPGGRRPNPRPEQADATSPVNGGPRVPRGAEPSVGPGERSGGRESPPSNLRNPRRIETGTGEGKVEEEGGKKSHLACSARGAAAPPPVRPLLWLVGGCGLAGCAEGGQGSSSLTCLRSDGWLAVLRASSVHPVPGRVA